jgi:hypothetical protein
VRSYLRPLVVLPGLLLLVFGCAAPSSGAGTATGRSSLRASSPLPESATGQGSGSAAAGPSSGVAGPSAPAAVSPSAAPTDVLPPGMITGNLGVADQQGDGTRLRLVAEVDGGPGWVVVQADRAGRPGKVLGVVHRSDGVHGDSVTVPLLPRVATGRLWVTLYLDRGRLGVFEHPGPDAPLQFAGKDLERSVILTVSPDLASPDATG